MPINTGIFESSGGGIAADRRWKLQAVNIVSAEEVRFVSFGVSLVSSLLGDNAALPTNFQRLVVGIGFGQDLSTPPVGDPITAPGTSDWLAVSWASNYVQPRSMNAGVNAWDLEMVLGDSGQRACPRASGTARSIWLVTGVLPGVTPPLIDWVGTAWLRYGSHSF